VTPCHTVLVESSPTFVTPIYLSGGRWSSWYHKTWLRRCGTRRPPYTDQSRRPRCSLPWLWVLTNDSEDMLHPVSVLVHASPIRSEMRVLEAFLNRFGRVEDVWDLSLGDEEEFGDWTGTGPIRKAELIEEEIEPCAVSAEIIIRTYNRERTVQYRRSSSESHHPAHGRWRLWSMECPGPDRVHRVCAAQRPDDDCDSDAPAGA
jgi:hypothetical protein